MRVRGLAAALLAAVSAAPNTGAADAPPFDPKKLPFTVGVGHVRTSYETLGVYVLPGETLTFTVDAPAGDASRPYLFAAGAEPAVTMRDRRARWTVPAARGLHPVRIHPNGEPEQTMTLNVFVMRPRADIRDGKLGDYDIGEYPKHPLRGLSIYEPPRGFVEVTEDLLDVAVSPHFTLGQFVCKQAGGYPKYVVLREKLLLKLELLLEHANAAGLCCDGFVVMSGYRTPAYNAAIGNVPYSRHVWGGAADIYIDVAPADGVMDDLDGNGVIDDRDAGVLRDLVERLSRRPSYAPFVGGLARYRAKAAHGPFVHVDVRGERARWGD